LTVKEDEMVNDIFQSNNSQIARLINQFKNFTPNNEQAKQFVENGMNNTKI